MADRFAGSGSRDARRLAPPANHRATHCGTLAAMNTVPDVPDTIRLYYYTAKRWALKVLWERRLKVCEYRELNDPFELMPFDAARPNAERRSDERLAALLAADHGVICFSDTWRNARMWSHYGERHTGICLGFDVLRVYAEPIVYLDRPLADPALPGGAGREMPLELFEAALRHKPAIWRDEREWRVRAPLTHRHDGVCYLPFDAAIELREVILGPRCTLQPGDVVDAVSSPPLDVEVYAARAAHGVFQIQRHELVETHRITGFRAELALAPDAYWHELGDPD